MWNFFVSHLMQELRLILHIIFKERSSLIFNNTDLIWAKSSTLITKNMNFAEKGIFFFTYTL